MTARRLLYVSSKTFLKVTFNSENPFFPYSKPFTAWLISPTLFLLHSNFLFQLTNKFSTFCNSSQQRKFSMDCCHDVVVSIQMLRGSHAFTDGFPLIMTTSSLYKLVRLQLEKSIPFALGTCRPHILFKEILCSSFLLQLQNHMGIIISVKHLLLTR